MKITGIELYKVFGKYETSDYFSEKGDRQVQQLDQYRDENNPFFTVKENNENDLISDIYLEIKTDSEISGIYGPININQAFIINNNLKKHLLDCNPLSVKKLYDQMLKLNRHGRSGLFITAVSSIDLALWDLKAKKLGVPVYSLLGGPTRKQVPAYASMLGFSIKPEPAAEVALEYKEKGYSAQKWFFRYGPAAGKTGLDKNIALVKALREAVGENYPLMFDAYMGWNVNYTIQMLKKIEKFDPTWVEEVIPPERIAGFEKIKAETSVPLATGEHVYTRWQVQNLLAAGVINYIQTDPVWTGGITELIKICEVSSSFSVPVIAHGHSLLPALQTAAAFSPGQIPYVEYLIRHQQRKQFFRKQKYIPEQGQVDIPSVSGMGIKLDPSKIVKREKLFE